MAAVCPSSLERALRLCCGKGRLYKKVAAAVCVCVRCVCTCGVCVCVCVCLYLFVCACCLLFKTQPTVFPPVLLSFFLLESMSSLCHMFFFLLLLVLQHPSCFGNRQPLATSGVCVLCVCCVCACCGGKVRTTEEEKRGECVGNGCHLSNSYKHSFFPFALPSLSHTHTHTHTYSHTHTLSLSTSLDLPPSSHSSQHRPPRA